MRISVFLILCLLALSAVCLYLDRLQAQDPETEYHRVAIERFIKEGSGWPHVEVAGYLKHSIREHDKDDHLDICVTPKDDEMRCFVAEIIPQLRIPINASWLRQKVLVRGIPRWDPRHKWYEIHPVIEILPNVPSDE